MTTVKKETLEQLISIKIELDTIYESITGRISRRSKRVKLDELYNKLAELAQGLEQSGTLSFCEYVDLAGMLVRTVKPIEAFIKILDVFGIKVE